MIAAFTDLVVRGQHAVQRALRTQVAILVEQRGVDLRRRAAFTTTSVTAAIRGAPMRVDISLFQPRPLR